MKRLKIIMLIVAFVLPALLLVETLYASCLESCENDEEICSEEDLCDPEDYFYMELQGTGADYETCWDDPEYGCETCDDWEGNQVCIEYWLCSDYCAEKEYYADIQNWQCWTD